MLCVLVLCVLAQIAGISEATSLVHAGILTVAYEASSEPYEGQVMVASVIKTRMLRRKQTIKEVVYAPSQFSCWLANGKPAQTRELTFKEIETAIRAWREARPGRWTNYTRFDCRPEWTHKASETIRVGKHLFYAFR